MLLRGQFTDGDRMFLSDSGGLQKNSTYDVKLCTYTAGNIQEEAVMTEGKKCSKMWLHFAKNYRLLLAISQMIISSKGDMLKHIS